MGHSLQLSADFLIVLLIELVRPIDLWRFCM